MDRVAVLLLLFEAEVIAAVRADGHDVRGAVREPDARTSQSNPGHMVGEIADGVRHCLVACRDAAGSGIIVCSEVRGYTTAFGGFDDPVKGVPAFFVHDDLGGFHHRLHLQRTCR